MNSKKKMWNYVLNNPCQHFAVGPFMAETFNLIGKACKISKVINTFLMHNI